MSDKVRIVPASERYPGMVEITRNGRSFQMIGQREHVEPKLRAYVDRVVPA